MASVVRINAITFPTERADEMAVRFGQGHGQDHGSAPAGGPLATGSELWAFTGEQGEDGSGERPR